MRAYSRGFEHYANDPAMQAVTEAKAALTVLTVLPPREVLFEQFLRRARNGEYEEWWDKRRLMRGLKHRLRGRSTSSPGEAQSFSRSVISVSSKCMDRIRRSAIGRIAGRHFSTACGKDRDDVRLVYVAPEPAQDEHRRFHLLRRV